MDKEKIKEVIENHKDKSNNDIAEAMKLLKQNFDDTKKLVVDLTYRLDSIENKYNTLNSELKKRIK
jgi:prefoldin subunit 5|tara:strand:+ start:135 stop:332 length:198 start_codon:yes stop_codon:yes gene_type:complete